MGSERLPSGAQAFIVAVAIAAAAILTLLISSDSHFDIGVALGFGALAFLSEQFPITLATGNSSSVTFVITMAAVVVAGPAEAAVASAFATFILKDPVRRRRPPMRLVFNAGQLVLSTALAGLAYQGLGGPIGQRYDIFPKVLPALVVATGVDFATNTGLVGIVMSLAERVSLRDVLRSQYRALAQGYIAFAPLGLLLAILYIQMGIGSIAFLLVPLLVARTAFQAAVNMQGAYDTTVRSLIKAIEAKDPYTSGHAERVALLSELVAREYGLTDDHVRVIRYAALMHDVGKLGVSNLVLKKPGKLTPDEYEEMKIHPSRAVEIVGEIDFLRDAIDGIRHHHERLDGLGYPDGLEGERVPFIARLIMVADAFDSMTSTRRYRKAKTIEEAFAELHRCAGTQFDAQSIAALERALTKANWVPVPEPRDEAESDARAASL